MRVWSACTPADVAKARWRTYMDRLAWFSDKTAEQRRRYIALLPPVERPDFERIADELDGRERVARQDDDDPRRI
jgi:hypothetical protein